jgi:tetratricopeptide (TPR) repeat protein
MSTTSPFAPLSRHHRVSDTMPSWSQPLRLAARLALLTVTVTLQLACGESRTPDAPPRDVTPSIDPSVGIALDWSAPSGVEAISLLGDTLRPSALSDEARARLQANLDSAEAALAAAPDDADALIWVGRRQAYLGRYREAIATFSRGVERFPNDARFLRHRGHRFLTVRALDAAVADFTRAGELEAGRADAIEPDGAPNAAGIPLSTTQFNIWYHLGLAHFLKGDWAKALEAYDRCLAVSTNPDLQVATAYWRYMTLRRLGRDTDAIASIAFAGDSMTLLENDGYLALLRLFRGDVSVGAVLPPTPEGTMDVANSTAAFGVGMWHRLNGREADATELFRRIIAGGQWAAFGSLAAEAELAFRPTGS